MEVDYRLVCRTCLASEVEFYKLDAPINTETDVEDEHLDRITFMECLRYCTRLPDMTGFPIYICTECSNALQVAFNFVKNALEAHDVLSQKLYPAGQCVRAVHGKAGSYDRSIAERMRFRCKVCGEKVESKKSLKEHVKLHLDIISYCCQVCNFECKKRSHLSEHYSNIHAMEATREQLKAKTALQHYKSSSNLELKKINQTDEFDIKFDVTHNASAVVQQQENAISMFSQCQQQRHQRKQIELQELQQPIDVDTLVAEDGAAIVEHLQDFSQELPNEMIVGNEFIVMADGTVEKVMGNGVVIEYINAMDENNLALTNTNDLILNEDMDNIDVDDIIIEESVTTEASEEAETASNLQYGNSLHSSSSSLSSSSTTDMSVSKSKTLRCKICSDNFLSQDYLKTHMLTHNEIPHFFCDRCPFYTFFKVDLLQHYKTLHKLEPTYKQLLPKNKIKCEELVTNNLEASPQAESDCKYIYNCDMCLYETNAKFNLRRHYLSKHNLDATDVQLRPTMEKDDIEFSKPFGTKGASEERNARSVRFLRPDYPDGLNCYKCNETFYWRNTLKEHCKQHNLEESADEIIHTSENMGQGEVATVAESLQNAHNNSTLHSGDTKVAQTLTIDHDNFTTSTSSSISVNTNTHTLPLDALPQVVEVDDIIDDTEMDFEFNQESIFDDFDEENDDNKGDEQDLPLTSDDDFEDLLEEQLHNNSTNSTHAVCIHCNKKFISQYQFENHMFVHRGLAPYRCEMCTNLYNTKRALIRHYKAVHKKIPTRDMIQAKGDKVFVEKTPVEHLNLEQRKSVTLMCAKCPYESTEMNCIRIHLKTSHGILEECFILRKLPFECPRCIRSYETKSRLIRHLERSHSVATIIQPKPTQPQSPSGRSCNRNTVDSTRTPTTKIIALTNNASVSQYGGTIVEQDALKEEKEHAAANKGYKQELIASCIAGKWHSSRDMNVGDRTIVDKFSETTTTTATFTNDPTLEAGVPHHEQLKSELECLKRKAAAVIHTADGGVRYQCQACDFTCDTLLALDEHSRQHPRGRTRDTFNFKCHICQCKYKSLVVLKNHLKRHLDRKYGCTMCPKTYINRTELEHHIMTHTGEMPYRCDSCGKKFRYPQHLTRHNNMYHLGQQHCCPVAGCKRKFTSLVQLKIHGWNHKGI